MATTATAATPRIPDFIKEKRLVSESRFKPMKPTSFKMFRKKQCLD